VNRVQVASLLAVTLLVSACGTTPAGPGGTDTVKDATSSDRAAAKKKAPQACAAEAPNPADVTLIRRAQKPLAALPGVHGSSVTPESLRKSATTPGRRGLELTARDFFAALEEPSRFDDPNDLKTYADADLNPDGRRLINERIVVSTQVGPSRWQYRRKVLYHSEMTSSSVGWIEQMGWSAPTPNPRDIVAWQGRRAMLVWSENAWHFSCLTDALPMDVGTAGLTRPPKYATGLDWSTYTK
jgi:hypothetical protein